MMPLGGGDMLDIAMILILLGSIGLIWLLLRWCADQVEAEE